MTRKDNKELHDIEPVCKNNNNSTPSKENNTRKRKALLKKDKQKMINISINILFENFQPPLKTK